MLKNKLLKFLFHLVLVTKYFTFSEILANGVTVILANGVTVILANGLTVILANGVTVILANGVTVILANGVTVILANGVTVIALNNNRFSGHLQYKKLSKILPSYVLLLALKLFTRVNTKV